jgi:ribosome-associated protein
MDIRKLQRTIVDALEDVKAQDIRVFNTEALTSLFDRVIIASGSSNRQTRALAASVRDKVRGAGGEVRNPEGAESGEWVLVDCGDAVVHLMQPAIRAYYKLEDIWGGKSVHLKAGQDARAAKAAAAKAAAPAGAAKPAARPAAKRPAAKRPAAKRPAAKRPAVRSAGGAASASRPAAAAGSARAGSAAAGSAPAKAPARKPAAKGSATKTSTSRAAPRSAAGSTAASKTGAAPRRPRAKTA